MQRLSGQHCCLVTRMLRACEVCMFFLHLCINKCEFKYEYWHCDGLAT